MSRSHIDLLDEPKLSRETTHNDLNQGDAEVVQQAANQPSRRTRRSRCSLMLVPLKLGDYMNVST
eukprot:1071069-Amphidinium_carterae.2